MREVERIIPTVSSRRSLLAGGGALLAGLAVAGCQRRNPAGAQSSEAGGTRTSLHQDERFSAPPKRVYEVLLSSSEFTAFSGLSAQIDPVVGGAISLFGAQVLGTNLDLVRDQRIVQAWRAADWPAGIFSIVRFTLAPVPTGTMLSLDQTGFQQGQYDHLNSGWAPHYWEPMRKYFAAHG